MIFQERWYNLNEPILRGFAGQSLYPELSDGATFNVDNPVLWNVLRPCLELANRLFKASARHPLYVLTQRVLWKLDIFELISSV